MNGLGFLCLEFGFTGFDNFQALNPPLFETDTNNETILTEAQPLTMKLTLMISKPAKKRNGCLMSKYLTKIEL